MTANSILLYKLNAQYARKVGDDYLPHGMDVSA